MEKSKVKDPGLAAAGKLRVEWAESRMPGPHGIEEKHGRDKSLKGMRVAGCLHVTKETAVLVKTIVAAGAEISWSGCNPLSTQDDVAAALAADGMSRVRVARADQGRVLLGHRQDPRVQADADPGRRRGSHLQGTHAKHGALAGILGGTEETTTGVIACGRWAARAAPVPGHRGQRRGDQVGLRQRLRHGPVLDRRHPPRDRHTPRGQNLRHRRLRTLRARSCARAQAAWERAWWSPRWIRLRASGDDGRIRVSCRWTTPPRSATCSSRPRA